MIVTAKRKAYEIKGYGKGEFPRVGDLVEDITRAEKSGYRLGVVVGEKIVGNEIIPLIHWTNGKEETPFMIAIRLIDRGA